MHTGCWNVANTVLPILKEHLEYLSLNGLSIFSWTGLIFLVVAIMPVGYKTTFTGFIVESLHMCTPLDKGDLHKNKKK